MESKYKQDCKHMYFILEMERSSAMRKIIK